MESTQPQYPNKPAQKKTPVQMLSAILESVISKLAPKKKENQTENHTETAPPPQTPTPDKPGAESQAIHTATAVSTPKNKLKIPKKLIASVVVLVIILVVSMVAMSTLRKNNGGAILPTPTPSTTLAPTPISDVPSQYADDEDVAEIRRQMQELDNDLNQASFREDTLRIPSLDWNVSFE